MRSPWILVSRCDMTAYPDCAYNTWVPAGLDMAQATPVVVLLHCGGGNAFERLRGTCPDRADGDGPDLNAPSCFHRIADREGFVVVVPNGTGTPAAPQRRTWNAGGGRDGWHCVSGAACTDGVDDLGYLKAVLDDLDQWLHVDRGAVFATGLSNAAHRRH
ncbi:MAG: hypothetical protein AAGD10_04185 [Myxococcota bacterium]